jgi:hypothetical protein
MTNTRVSQFIGPLIAAVIGLEWLRSGIEKLTASDFPATTAKVLAGFASRNPTGWYRDFLTSSVIPNATAFGYLIEWAETITGAALIVTAGILLYRSRGRIATAAETVAGIALLGGALMSWNFWLAAGWMSESTDGVNLVMGLSQLVLLAGVVASFVLRSERRTGLRTVEGRPTRGTAHPA